MSATKSGSVQSPDVAEAIRDLLDCIPPDKMVCLPAVMPVLTVPHRRLFHAITERAFTMSGGLTFWRVPDGESWWVHQMSLMKTVVSDGVIWIITATPNGDDVMYQQSADSGDLTGIQIVLYENILSGATAYYVKHFNPPLLLTKKTNVIVYWTKTTANETFKGEMVFEREKW